MVKSCQLIAVFMLVFSTQVKAIELQFPVACQLGATCWITNHVDLDRRNGVTEDYMCGSKTTDNAKSTHISLRNVNASQDKTPVIATADGTITTARHIGGFCGTRVVIDHDNGWQSSYCHLNPTTLNVIPGQDVQKNQILGTIGQSGQADWPRLSYALLRNGMVFDPFSGRTNLEGCSATSKPLWLNGLNPIYEPAQVTSIGFNIGVINGGAITQGTAKHATAMRADAPELTLWALMMNVQKGDKIEMVIFEPSGRELHRETITSPHDRAQMPIFTQAKRGQWLWDKGTYKGVITVMRRVHGNVIRTGKFINVELR
jgi:hypothetical protein